MNVLFRWKDASYLRCKIAFFEHYGFIQNITTLLAKIVKQTDGFHSHEIKN